MNTENELNEAAKNPEVLIATLSQELRKLLADSGIKDYEVDAIMKRLGQMDAAQLTKVLIKDIPEMTNFHGSETAYRIVIMILVVFAALIFHVLGADLLTDQLQFLQQYLQTSEFWLRMQIFFAMGAFVWPSVAVVEGVILDIQLKSFQNLLRKGFLGKQAVSSGQAPTNS